MEKKGLTKEEAEKRLKTDGYNEIKEIDKTSVLKILLRQIKSNFIIYLLVIAMAISFFVDKNITAYTILAVIILVISIGFVQEYKAEKAVESLKKMVLPISIVIRDGKETEILSKEIVPGDILILGNGEKIPADCIILEENDLFVNESILTGEAREIQKFSARNIKKYNEKNMLFMGSFIVGGRAIGKVIHTGMNTKFGKIANLISITEKELPLQKKINKITKYMAIIGITMAVLTGLAVFFTSEISNTLIVEILILTIAIAVSAFPEGFPVVLISALSLGMYRMASKNAIVNRMSIIETLGETSVICTDKTGTITKGEMTVKKIYSNNNLYSVTGAGYEGKGEFMLHGKSIDVKKDKTLNLLLKTAILCNNASIKRTGEDMFYHITGLPTEGALLVMASKAKLFKENFPENKEKELTFSSERKMMSILTKQNGYNLYSKGAPEVLLQKCKYLQREDGVFRILEKDRKRILEENKKMTSEALRTIALAYKKTNCSNRNCVEEELIFLGIVGIEDPPREEIKDALITCKTAGISVKMITGDNKETAISIANQIGLDKGKIIEGDELDKLTDVQLIKLVGSIVIFARVRPEHKLRIVRALKENGEIVTMTGDGVNDSPALKEAHIGVAMGKNGTDVSRDVADLILKDDNFATIVDAIKEGRTIFNNIQKFISYQLSCNYAELFILFIGVLMAPILGWPIPILLALHILFMNLVTDNLPAITLGFNSSSKDIMEEKPRKGAQILNKKLFLIFIFAGTLMALFTLGTFWFTFNILNQSIENARTTTLVSLIVLEIAGAFNFRSFRKGVFNRSISVNKYLLVASIISILATIIIIYTPLNKIFETIPIPFIDWIVALAFSLILIGIFDILKIINNKTKFFRIE